MPNHKNKNKPAPIVDPMEVFSDFPTNNAENQENKVSIETEKPSAKNAARLRQTEVLNDTKRQTEFIEEFLKQDSWLVFGEAIPICLGIHPLDTNDIAIFEIPEFNAFKETVKSSEGESLTVLNRNDQPVLWRTAPEDFVRWAESKEIQILNALTKNTSEETELDSSSNKVKAAQEREKVYIAALAVLANNRESCLDENGLVSAARVFNVIRANASLWFESGKLPMEEQLTIQLISKAIETTNSSIPR